MGSSKVEESRRQKTGGRQKGTPNKLTASAKDAFALAFDEIGGPEALAEWGMENRTEFYKLFSKLIPINANVSGDLNLSWPLPQTKLDQ